MASQIDERHELGTARNDLLHCLVLQRRRRVVCRPAVGVETCVAEQLRSPPQLQRCSSRTARTENLLADAGRATVLNLVHVSTHLQTLHTRAVVQRPRCKHTNECALATVDVADDGHCAVPTMHTQGDGQRGEQGQ